MKQELNVLVVSGNLEHKRTLLKIFRELPIRAFTRSTIGQARELLLAKSADLILCDENLVDGSYKDFLRAVRPERRVTRFEVLLESDAWDDYLDAIHLGVSEVIRCPFQPTDIEMALVRAAREVWIKQEESRLPAST